MNPFRGDRRRLFNGLWHVSAIALAFVFAYLLRFDFRLTPAATSRFWTGLWIVLAVKTVAFYLTGLYRRWWWKFIDVIDLHRVFVGNLVASTGFATAGSALIGPAFPRSVYAIDFLVCLLLTGILRFAGRLHNERILSARQRSGGKGLLIYGAGVAGTMLVREIRANPRLNYRAIGFLDDDPNMHGAILLDVPVLGSGRDVTRIVDRYKGGDPAVDEIVIAMPSVAGHQAEIQQVFANCRSAGVPCKIVPSHSELLSGKVSVGHIKDVSLTDLLGREPAQLDETRAGPGVAGRSVLITGAAGSIGSELCLQVASLNPGKLIALDQAESGLFIVERALRKKLPSLNLVVEVGDIRDRRRMDEIVYGHSVDCVFHAAAYKHITLMERNPQAAVRTNILGTWNLMQAASRHGVSKFVMISSDKAVNPTSIMGVTKRVAELLLSAMPVQAGAGTKYVSVRFGNVLGSAGSVVPIFRAQIAAGGPLTVTHPQATRYFMTVREAVHLILQASTMGKGGEVFVLDMGEPIRIVDLARNMIRLSGMVPDEDIEIRYVGLRPGEKLCEELIATGESMLSSGHEKIRIYQGPQMPADVIEAWMARLGALMQHGDDVGLVRHLKELVPDYQPSEAWSDRRGDERGRGVDAALRPQATYNG